MPEVKYVAILNVKQSTFSQINGVLRIYKTQNITAFRPFVCKYIYFESVVIFCNRNAIFRVLSLEINTKQRFSDFYVKFENMLNYIMSRYFCFRYLIDT